MASEAEEAVVAGESYLPTYLPTRRAPGDVFVCADSSHAEHYCTAQASARSASEIYFWPVVMPLSFANFPGVGGGNALVLARGAEDIYRISHISHVPLSDR
eukprot:6107959-Prymnesium_polylepis.1